MLDRCPRAKSQLPDRAASLIPNATVGGSAGWVAAVEPAPDTLEWDAIYTSINAGVAAFKDKPLLC